MDPKPEGQEPHNPPVVPQAPATKVEVDAAEFEELKKKAEVSSNNYEIRKKLEAEKKELEEKLSKQGNSPTLDPEKLTVEIETKVDLRMKGYAPEDIREIERYAKGAGLSLSEAEKSPFVQKAIEALRTERKSKENTPNPSSKIPTFGGKTYKEVIAGGSDEEKQAAFSARMKGSKGNE